VNEPSTGLLNLSNGAQYAPLTHALSLSAQLDGETTDLVIADADVLEAVKRNGTLNAAIYNLLKIGSTATLATSAGFDVQAVQRELDRAVAETADVVKNVQTGLEHALGDDGPFADACRQANQQLQECLRDVFTKQSDPESAGSLISKIQSVIRRCDEMLATTRKEMAEQLASTTQRQSDYITKALREMRDLDPNSAIGGAFARVEKGLADLNTVIAASQASAAALQRSAIKGFSYEEQVASVVADIAAVHGDRAEQTGTQPGRLLNNKRAALRGDVTVYVDEAPRIVAEAMDRDKSKLTRKLVYEELDEAMQNRDAAASIAVMSTMDGTLMCGQPLQIVARNMWAVYLSKDQPSVLPLQVAYRLARTAAMTITEQPEVDFETLKAGVDEINHKLLALKDVRTQLSNIGTAQEKAYSGLAQFEREMRESIIRLVTSLETQRTLQDQRE
jgi:hypothetical protein